MKTLHVYDPAMCCSTGVCGPQVDPALVRFAADLKWLVAQRVEVQRFNLAQSPAAFAQSELVRAALTEKGEGALPLLLVDGKVAAAGRYPERKELAGWFNLVEFPVLPKLPGAPAPGRAAGAATSGDSCCGGTC